MKSLIAGIFMTVLFTGLTGTSVFQNKNKLAGDWQYEVKTVPENYQKGILNFSEKEDQLAGEVKFTDGSKIVLNDISFSNDSLNFGIYIDYQYISVKTKIDGNKIKGIVNSPDGIVEVTAEKIE